MREIKKRIKRCLVLLLAVAMMITAFDLTPFSNVNAEAASTLASSAPVLGTSKKGVQGLDPWYYTAVESGGCNVDHVFDNLVLTDYYSESYRPYWQEFTAGGVTFYMNTTALIGRAWNYKRARDKGCVTYCTILLNASSAADNPNLCYAGTRTTSDTIFVGFNTKTTAGKAVVKKVMSVLADCYGDSVDYWILGNEVNQRRQYDIGTTSIKSYGNHYALAMTYCYSAMKTVNPDVSILVSLDHCWNTTNDNRFLAYKLIDQIASYTASHTEFNWGIAYHPYSEPLEQPRFWEEHSTVTNSNSTIIITMKNIDVLTNYMQKSSLLYKGKVRPIALTEVGFSSYGKKQDSQAAAVAASYYITESNPYIVSILYNMVEYDKYCFSVCGKKAENVFRYMDTTIGHTYSDPYLKFINGAKDWSSVIPNYSNVKITKTVVTAKLTLSSCSTTELMSGSTVKLTAKGTGNGTLKYRFYLATSTSYCRELTLQDYSTNNTYTGKIRTYGKAKIYVDVMDSTGNIVRSSNYLKVNTTSVADKYIGIETYAGVQYYIWGGKWWYKFNSYESGYRKLDGISYWISDGIVNTNATGLYYNSPNGRTYYFENGIAQWKKTFAYYNYGQYYYVYNGRFRDDITGLRYLDGVYYYFNSGISYGLPTGVYQYNNTWVVLIQGCIDENFTGVQWVHEQGEYCYFENGYWRNDYTGYYTDSDGTEYYFVNGVRSYDYPEEESDENEEMYAAEAEVEETVEEIAEAVEVVEEIAEVVEAVETIIADNE